MWKRSFYNLHFSRGENVGGAFKNLDCVIARVYSIEWQTHDAGIEVQTMLPYLYRLNKFCKHFTDAINTWQRKWWWLYYNLSHVMCQLYNASVWSCLSCVLTFWWKSILNLLTVNQLIPLSEILEDLLISYAAWCVGDTLELACVTLSVWLLRLKGTFGARKSQVLDEACYSTETQTVT